MNAGGEKISLAGIIKNLIDDGQVQGVVEKIIIFPKSNKAEDEDIKNNG